MGPKRVLPLTKVTDYLQFFSYKNHVYKNVEAQISQNIRVVLCWIFIVWELHCGSCIMWEFCCVEFALHGSGIVCKWRCVGVTLCGSDVVWE